jgi:phosphatidylserine/phosphatidylglycerophosphate/cardiolipin synthase-like enzyme
MGSVVPVISMETPREGTGSHLLEEAREMREHRRDLDKREQSLATSWEALRKQREALSRQSVAQAAKEQTLSTLETDLLAKQFEQASLRDSLGSVVSLHNAASTLLRWVELISKGRGGEIDLICYTFDLEVVVSGLEEARKRHNVIRLLINKGSAATKGTKQLLDRLETVESHVRSGERKLQIKVAEGTPLREQYIRAGQNSPIQSKKGIVHAKFLRVNSTLLVGSCNWTTSSQCNREAVLESDLTTEGLVQAKKLFESYWATAEPL